MNIYLAESCGNTFVLFDCLQSTVLDEPTLKIAHERLLKENRDDALLLLDVRSYKNAVETRMVVLGADGTFAEFCGNGARAAAAFLFAQYPEKEQLFLRTGYGKHAIYKHEDSAYSIRLPLPQCPAFSSFIPQGIPEGFAFVDMLEPHLVYQGKLEQEELMHLGTSLNQKKKLFPYGINVNACNWIDKDTLFVMTYERGVQRLTKSCGSGSLACAFLYRRQGIIRVQNPGGMLEISFSKHSAILKGPSFFY